MNTINTIDSLSKIKPSCVLTIGNFDGVHLGHLKIIDTAKQKASELSTQLVAMTFEPHPVAVLHPEKAPPVLTPLSLKKQLLEKNGVDTLIVLKDTAELLKLTPRDFVEQFLVKNVKPAFVVEGENFNFGLNRTGSVHTLAKLGDEQGFKVIIVEPEMQRFSTGYSIRVSSTLIRNMLTSGKLVDTRIALGRPYRLIQKIIKGRGKGKHLGFPTANIEPNEQIIPQEGVYAGLVTVAENFDKICSEKTDIPAAFSIGRAITFGPSHPKLVEAHLLKENVPDLIGKYLAMDFIKYIRHQQNFKSENELAKQIAIDCKKAKEILSKN